MNTKTKQVLVPVLLGVFTAVAFILGAKFGEKRVLTEEGLFQSPRKLFDGEADVIAARKMSDVLHYVSSMYVDTVNMSELVDRVIPQFTETLDPHTAYIKAEDLQITNDELASSFFGIGVQFNLRNDTVNVVQVISGGPSEKAGLRAGDKIIAVDDSVFVGPKLNNEVVVKTLRGPKDTHVKLGIKRKGVAETLDYEVIRGEVAQETVDAFYMADDQTGYVKIDRFGERTHEEFYEALLKLQAEGARRYIVDLRNNGGGFLPVAGEMLNFLLDEGDTIVYTCGRGQTRANAGEVLMSRGAPIISDPIVVLINENSASASEIFAGAIQDNDRGVIVGSRSFGKGLVQQQIPISGGAALRLTIARYYTPSGRCVQKYYGKDYDYRAETAMRYEHGEMTNVDSMKKAAEKDSMVYKTCKLGRTVYGGGGIMPDIFVPLDTNMSAFAKKVLLSDVVYDFSFKYIENHPSEIEAYKETGDFKMTYKNLMHDSVCREFLAYAKREKNFSPSDREPASTQQKIMRLLAAYMIRSIHGSDDHKQRPFYWAYNLDDNAFREALKAFTSKEMKEILER
ncbi:MAG: S41 family peptidase [Bacteroidales bacterium]|jgi:carboxyl-terminal processing protease|nr:S41 family peptidase [Bacteroidales bacterium]